MLSLFLTTMEYILSAPLGQIKKNAFDEIVNKIIYSIF
jgi:hypothetical protein